ncbi:g9890 [Coccomyxa viridis]|uniref:G9890 protein n=1 Tax=Coccomyxa viridis TaxID=1274662 RepID=A0ABP1G446_9CHLO
MRYQVIPNAVLTPSQLLNGISYSTALPNEYLTVTKDPSDPTGPIYIQPTGAPKALVIQRDISAAAGKIHVVQGPLVPASLVPLLTGGRPRQLPVYVNGTM